MTSKKSISELKRKLDNLVILVDELKDQNLSQWEKATDEHYALKKDFKEMKNLVLNLPIHELGYEFYCNEDTEGRWKIRKQQKLKEREALENPEGSDLPLEPLCRICKKNRSVSYRQLCDDCSYD